MHVLWDLGSRVQDKKYSLKSKLLIPQKVGLSWFALTDLYATIWTFTQSYTYTYVFIWWRILVTRHLACKLQKTSAPPQLCSAIFCLLLCESRSFTFGAKQHRSTLWADQEWFKNHLIIYRTISAHCPPVDSTPQHPLLLPSCLDLFSTQTFISHRASHPSGLSKTGGNKTENMEGMFTVCPQASCCLDWSPHIFFSCSWGHQKKSLLLHLTLGFVFIIFRNFLCHIFFPYMTKGACVWGF